MKKIFFSLSLLATFAWGVSQENTSWYHLNHAQHNNYGIATEEANQFAEKSGRKASPIIVAVIDSGVDIEHEDLDDVLWTNAKEIPANGIDDDKNGYVDDLHGWNFIGGAEGNVEADNLEITRLVKKGKDLFDSPDEFTNNTNREKFPEKYEQYKSQKIELENLLAEAKLYKSMIGSRIDPMVSAFTTFGEEYGGLDKVITVEGIEEFQTTDPMISSIKVMLQSAIGTEGEGEVFGKTSNQFIEEIKGQVQHYVDQVDYHYNVDFDPRNIVGDNYEDVTESQYGNQDVKGADAKHGTHVAGIIAAERNNKIGIDGITSNARIMSVRTVPNGDERDKDVANAIRYAVDNGAKVINMSFGKAFSPAKETVWEAMRYATDKGVLLIHAAGNESKDIDTESNFPTNYDGDQEISSTWITVGASTPYSDAITAGFSNKGKKQVDIFAPGVQIYSTTPENTYESLQGTSMAAPVVSGVAALVWSYFPELTAQEIKEILIKSGNTNEQLMDISTHGVVVDAYKAMQLAAKMTAKK